MDSNIKHLTNAHSTTPSSSPLSTIAPTSPCTTPLRKTIPALNMRMKTFKRASGTIHESLNRCRSGKPLHRYSGCPRGSNLELLRKALQPSINREMSKMFTDYFELFSMANENIRENIAKDDDSRPEEFLLVAMKIALDEARRHFSSQFQSQNVNFPTMNNVVSNNNSNASNMTSSIQQRPPNKKRPVVAALDASRLLAVIDCGEFNNSPSTNPLHPPIANNTNTKRRPMQWSLTRIHCETLFTLGSRANKALGLGTTRGRLYIKHPEIFKYPADQADKQWLAENDHMGGVGGRVYLVFTEDLFELAESREYKNMPGVNASLINGFTLPNHILNKVRQYMTTMVQYIREAAANSIVTVHSDKGSNNEAATAALHFGNNVSPPCNDSPLQEINSGSSVSCSNILNSITQSDSLSFADNNNFQDIR